MEMEKTLDASSYKEQSFRLQLFTKNLPVLKKVEKWNSDKKIYTPDAICIRCEKEEETIEHLITCEKNLRISKNLYKYTTDIMEKRINNPTYKKLLDQHYKPTKKHLMYLIGFVKANYTKFMEFKSIYGLIPSDIQDCCKRLEFLFKFSSSLLSSVFNEALYDSIIPFSISLI